MKTIYAVVLVIFLAVYAQAANVVFFPTNQITGLADTNRIKISAVTPYVDSSGTPHTIGLPVYIYPSTNGYTWTNMSPGVYLATNQFLVSQFTGLGSIGGGSGILFLVDSSTNTYPFTRYPRSYSANGYNVFNWILGVSGIIGTNGFNVTQNADGTVTLDGQNFTAVVNYATITNALGGAPLLSANGLGVTNAIPTNSATVVVGQTVYVNTNYDAGGSAATVQVFANSSSVALSNITATVQAFVNSSTTAISNITTAMNLFLNSSTVALSNQVSTQGAFGNSSTTALSNNVLSVSAFVNSSTVAISNITATTTAALNSYTTALSNNLTLTTNALAGLTNLVNTAQTFANSSSVALSNITATTTAFLNSSTVAISNNITGLTSYSVGVSNLVFTAQAFVNSSSTVLSNWVNNVNTFLNSSTVALTNSIASSVAAQSVTDQALTYLVGANMTNYAYGLISTNFGNGTNSLSGNNPGGNATSIITTSGGQGTGVNQPGGSAGNFTAAGGGIGTGTAASSSGGTATLAAGGSHSGSSAAAGNGGTVYLAPPGAGSISGVAGQVYSGTISLYSGSQLNGSVAGASNLPPTSISSGNLPATVTNTGPLTTTALTQATNAAGTMANQATNVLGAWASSTFDLLNAALNSTNVLGAWVSSTFPTTSIFSTSTNAVAAASIVREAAITAALNASNAVMQANQNSGSNVVQQAVINIYTQTMTALAAGINAAVTSVTVAFQNTNLQTLVVIGTNGINSTNFTRQTGTDLTNLLNSQGATFANTITNVGGGTNSVWSLNTNRATVRGSGVSIANSSNYKWTPASNVWLDASSGYFVTNNTGSGNLILYSSAFSALDSWPLVTAHRSTGAKIGDSQNAFFAWGLIDDGSQDGITRTNWTLDNPTLNGGNYTGNSATATTSSNGVDQVVTFRASGNIYWGTAPLALSNAVTLAMAGDIIKWPAIPQTFPTPSISVSVSNLSIIGETKGYNDQIADCWINGSIINGGGFTIFPSALNFHISKCSINANNARAVYDNVGSAYYGGLRVEDVGISYTNAALALEGCFVSGNGLVVDGLWIDANLNQGYALIVKGSTNFSISNVHIHVPPTNGVTCINIKASQTNTVLTQNGSLTDFWIDSNSTNLINPVQFHCDEEGVNTNDLIVMSGIHVSNGHIRLPNALVGQVFLEYLQYTNDLINGLDIQNIDAFAPNAYSFDNTYDYLNVFPSTGSITNHSLQNCFLYSTNFAGGNPVASPYARFNAGTGSNWVTYNNITILNQNGAYTFNGSDTYWAPYGQGGYYLQTATPGINSQPTLPKQLENFSSISWQNYLYAGTNGIISIDSPAMGTSGGLHYDGSMLGIGTPGSLAGYGAYGIVTYGPIVSRTGGFTALGGAPFTGNGSGLTGVPPTALSVGATFINVDIPTNTLGTHGYSGYFTNGVFVSTGTY